MSDGVPVAVGDHLVGLACGHYWPGSGATDEDAAMFVDLLRVSGDTAWCPRCLRQERVTGPVAKVVSA